MNKKNVIMLVLAVVVSGCATNSSNGPRDDAPIVCTDYETSVTVPIKLKGFFSRKPEVGKGKEDICVEAGATITFVVTPANQEGVVVVPDDDDDRWLLGIKKNPAQFVVTVPAGLPDGEHKYWVFWTGRPALDPRIGVRGGHATQGELPEPQTETPNLPTEVNTDTSG